MGKKKQGTKYLFTWSTRDFYKKSPSGAVRRYKHTPCKRIRDKTVRHAGTWVTIKRR